MSRAALSYLYSRVSLFLPIITRDQQFADIRRLADDKPRVKVVHRNGVDIFVHEPKRQLSPSIKISTYHDSIKSVTRAVVALLLHRYKSSRQPLGGKKC